MLALLKKEISGFLSSILGYIVILFFLLITGLFLWVLPVETNIIDFGYAQLNGLFNIAPYVFLFLIPAITMRSFAEERRTGTIELLLTKPISDFKIIMSKFLASFILLLLSILPTLVYYFSVYKLGFPVGNIDTGSVIGSYIGLLLLGSAFISIGLFASSITTNQIVSFIIAVLLSGLLFIGFDLIYDQNWFGSFDLFVKYLGINHHYASISRGVIDTRDLLYFVSFIALFLLFTNFSLQKRA
jgi:ABC-2 type transport system permease protein